MKNRLMKTGAMLCALLLLVGAVAACGGGGGSGGAGAEAVIDDAVLASYVYVPTIIDLPTIPDMVSGAVVHGDRIFYFYTVHDRPPDAVDWATWEPAPPQVVVASVRTDGTGLQEIELPISGDAADVSGLTVLENGNIALILTERSWGDMSAETTVYYLELSQDGTELVREEMELAGGGEWFQIDQMLFLADGRMVIIAWTDNGTVVYLIDENRSIVGELSMEWTRGAAETADGRVLVFDWEMDGDRGVDVLRELDFARGDWGDSFPISIVNARSVHPARDGDPFDLIIDDGNFVYGYDLQTGERTPLFNWIEAGFAIDHGNHIGFLSNGQIMVLHSDWDRTSDDGSWRTELAILTRTPRSEVPEREIITLGGMGFWGEIRQQVVAFNRASQTHRIQVIDYSMYSTPDDWMAGMTRFLADLATGQGTDMVWGSYMNLAPLVDRGILADLNPYLDADAEIHRTDFFQNVLTAMETPDGVLPLLGNSFSIQTMVGEAAALQGITSWTFADMLALMEQENITDATRLLGQWMTGDRFLSMALMFSGQDFIDWASGRVNLDNEEFIQLLEIAAQLPREWNMDDRDWENYVSEFELMQRGEQMLSMAWLSQPNSLQTYMAVLDDVRALGVPTADGGAHLLMPNSVLGINESSGHQDVAWSFIRQILLPGAHTDWSFPLRIAEFEEQLEEAMTPEFWTDEDGVEHEVSRGGIGFGDGFMIDLYAVTEAEARVLREIVESASLLGRHDETVEEMVQQELLPFFAGDRSAADTARILQNRLQTYLSERMG